MCYFITVGVQREGAARLEDERRRSPRAPLLTVMPASNRSLRAMQRHPPRRRQEDASRQAFETLLATLSACSGGFRIFVHMYRSSPSLEGVPLGARAQLGLRAVLSSALPADTLIDVAKG